MKDEEHRRKKKSTSVNDSFWSQILRSSAQCVGAVQHHLDKVRRSVSWLTECIHLQAPPFAAAIQPRLNYADLCKSKVCNFDVALAIDEQILWFEISVYDIQRMNIGERKHDFRGIKSRNWILESVTPLQLRKKLPSTNKLHEHVEGFEILERCV